MIGRAVEQFFTIVGGAVTLGALFDAWVTSSRQRKVVRDFLRHPFVSESAESILLRYIDFVREIFFDRFFSHKFLSWRYFRNTSAISLVLLFLILVFQGALSPGHLAALSRSISQIAVLTLSVAANLVIDWLSWGITHALLRISALAKKASYSMLLGFCDVIVSINLFVLIFAVAVMLPIMTALMTPGERTFGVGVSSSPATKDSVGDDFSLLGLNKMRRPIEAKYVFEDLNESGSEYDIYVYSDSADVTFEDVLKAIGPTIGADAARVTNGLSKLNGDELKIAKPGSDEWNRLIAKEGYHEVQVVDMRAFPHIQPMDWSVAYQTGYVLAAANQRAFPAILGRRTWAYPLASLVEDFDSTKATLNPIAFACEASAGTTPAWKLVADADELGGNCRRKMSLRLEGPLMLADSIRVSSMKSANTKVLLNSFFMTSVLFTFFIYVFCIFLTMARFLAARVSGYLRKMEPLFLRAPFGTAGFVIGLLLFSVATLLG